jgi:hypothetical protein
MEKNKRRAQTFDERAQPLPPPRWDRPSGSNGQWAHSVEAKAMVRMSASKSPPAQPKTKTQDALAWAESN